MTVELASLARDISLPYYEEALPAHDCRHADRVRGLALRLAAACERSVDRDLVAAAAWFHDIGRPRERRGDVDDHGEWAAATVAERLADEPVSAETTAAIAHCLRAHSIRPSSPDPATVEAEILFDADKLDAAGATGLVRLACIVGERSGRSGEAYARLDRGSVPGANTADRPDVTLLREWARERLDALYTEPGRRIGAERWAFVEEFFAQLERERGPVTNA